MLSCTVPIGVRKLADRFKSLFVGTSLSYPALCALLAMYLFKRHCLSELVRCCAWSAGVSTLSRAVQGFDGNRFMKRLRGSILRRYGYMDSKDFVFAIDDTDNPRYGSGIYGKGYWHGSKGGYLGQKILVVALVDLRRNIAIPISYAFATKKGTLGHMSLIEQAVAILKNCLDEGFPHLPVVADSWFDSSELMHSLACLGITFVCELKSKRWVRGSAAPRATKRRLPDFFASEARQGVPANPVREPKKRVGRPGRRPRKSIAERVGKINGFKSPLKIVAVFNSASRTRAFAYYASTDRTMSGARIWLISRARWAIEVLFRELKQNLSFGRLPCRGKNAADLAVCLPFAIYMSIVDEANEVWGLSHVAERSVGASLEEVREEALNSAVNLMMANPLHKVVKSLRTRRSKDTTRQKPRTTPAGRENDCERPAA